MARSCRKKKKKVVEKEGKFFEKMNNPTDFFGVGAVGKKKKKYIKNTLTRDRVCVELMSI